MRGIVDLRPQDHPRIRGEHTRMAYGRRLSVGSSPHTRGAPDQTPYRRRRNGIIPAYAGSTPPSGPPKQPGRDHPRIRGEHGLSQTERLLATGSSPHTRGARDG